MLPEKCAVRADFDVVTGFTYQLQLAIMHRTSLAERLTPLLLPIIKRVSLQRLDYFDYAHVLGNIVSNALPNDCLSSAVRAEKYSAIGLDCESKSHAFFAEGMPAFRDNARGSIVEIELIVADSAVRSDFLCCLVVHFLIQRYLK